LYSPISKTNTLSDSFVPRPSLLSHTTELIVRKVILRGPFANFVDSPYYSESELCGGTVTVSFSKYLPWQANSMFGLEKVDRWNPIRTSAIQSRSRPMRFLGFSDHKKELRGKKFRSDQRSATRFREVGEAL
jgi:hypothetical protein